MYVIEVGAPNRFTSAELDAFRSFMKHANQVDQQGLMDRILSAKLLAFVKIDGTNDIVAVSGVKMVDGDRVMRIFRDAQSTIGLNHARNGMLEYGWVYVSESHRRRGVFKEMTKAVMARMRGQPIFATAYVNEATTRVNHEVGLLTMGRSFEGRRSGQEMYLFYKEPNA